jgi:hypothetical protein
VVPNEHQIFLFLFDVLQVRFQPIAACFNLIQIVFKLCTILGGKINTFIKRLSRVNFCFIFLHYILYFNLFFIFFFMVLFFCLISKLCYQYFRFTLEQDTFSIKFDARNGTLTIIAHDYWTKLIIICCR